MTLSPIPHIRNIADFVEITNTQLADLLYISLPDTKEKRAYRGNFVLLNKLQSQKIAKEKNISLSKSIDDSSVFVYNERIKKIIPFKKNDYLTHEHGYFTYDGKQFSSHDDDGNVYQNFAE